VAGVAAISSEAIGSALRTIQARLIDVRQQIEILTREQKALEQAEQSLLAVLGERPSLVEAPHPAASESKSELAGQPRQGSLRARLQTVLKEAGPGGHTIQHLRALFPDANGKTLAVTLSNLKGAGLIHSKDGCWLIRGMPQATHSSSGGADIENVSHAPGQLHNVSDRDYEVVTHPRTGVSLARRA
jgi:hypothetical protein